ncbi:L-lactate dehydrogenase [Spiroplasma syrphidicola EA-1]|uniref:L-lactate dehydrogenase n=1 Tax=Spiroplasma syrphidicola EA-1 TaxID=1276229 RepID=R4UL48_9MOLU|nr:L-lactate dehydrogenase [Spiroplasma syrphidicola]AGM25981.1 L-lactate dehydrogenase [Spiroplasma syrphidicola EA-1]
MKNRKVVLVGTGAVGTSFLYSAINQGIAQEYILIDVNVDAAEGQALDLADGNAFLPHSFASIRVGTYSDCHDADVIVITAGRPQKPGETRIDMVADNAKIMKSIALEIKKSGFSGITVVASNPVDILTTVYYEVTGFDKHSIIGSGTSLDSARLRRLVAEKLNVGAKEVSAVLMGEHGDSSTPIWSTASVMGKPIAQYVAEGKLTDAQLDEITQEAIHMAYKIIEKKRATFYGIGIVLTDIVRAVLCDENKAMMVGAYLDGNFGHQGIYTGVPAIVNNKGWSRIINWNLTAKEQAGFDASCQQLTEVVNHARAAIK